MTVIINELDVTTQTATAPQAPTSSPPPTPAPAPFELRSTLRHMSRRAQRLRAD